ncbi:hypothetical protein MFLAVUS_008603 [Mucor flavus]|uniref:Uncharacterized protein n=1 Tax=Mucor flavus TaxID=439312 RepID=A0ABP9Z7R2_9FUNG
MKFGKRIQSQKFPEWSSHYLDYKGLKKFISALSGSEETKKASFFFKLERELEKINTFYLQKENDAQVRLKTLQDKKKLLQLDPNRLKHSSAQLDALNEAFTQYERDLNKLQKYVQLNNEGFQKILKKWDKRSKSQTKELYLSRQVDIQPCFKPQVLSELGATSSTSRIELLDMIKTANKTPCVINSPKHSQQTDDVELSLIKAVASNMTQLVKHELGRVSTTVDENRISRAFFQACSTACIEIVQLLIDTGMVHFDYIDDINERSCLHIAAMNGRFDILKLVVASQHVNRRDIYGRTPLHYATMKGYDDCISFLLDRQADIEARDLDGFSPLLCAISNGYTKSVEILLNAGANIEPKDETDHIPLSVACYYGHTDIALMLYRRGAKNLANTELLYPLHLVAQQGHAELCRILAKDPEYLDKPDVYYNWTPLFWAANYGHTECVRILIEEKCQLNLKDENGKTALHYAAWEGHTKCTQLMIDAGCRVDMDVAAQPTNQENNDDMLIDENELDHIPSLELPPPIIPFRIYGHNYLDRKYQIHVILKQTPIRLYDNTPISSLKLVISVKPDTGVIPHGIILPMSRQREIFHFQLDSLDGFLLEFDVLPTFGTHILGRAVIPISLLKKATEGHRIIPLMDNHLTTVGELDFDYFLVRPFLGVQLKIGGRIETYWKSKVTGSTLLTGVAENHLPATVVSSFITASSLNGDYSHIVVQLTRDRVPVVFANWMVPFNGLDLAVSDLSFNQLCQLAKKIAAQTGSFDFTGNIDLVNQLKQDDPVLALSQILQRLPASMGVLLEIKYPNIDELDVHPFPNILDKNEYADTILLCIYDHVRSLPSDVPNTRIVFTSFNPTVCTIVNWKQPNYPVFFSTCCMIDKGEPKYKSIGNAEINVSMRPYSNALRTSLKEAVKFSKRNNLLGIISDAATLVRIPSLISNIKESGLVLVTFGDANQNPECIEIQKKQGVDAIMIDGLVHYNSEISEVIN